MLLNNIVNSNLPQAPGEGLNIYLLIIDASPVAVGEASIVEPDHHRNNL
jgi:hypothetical protein